MTCIDCGHARHVHASKQSDWEGCRVIGCSCPGFRMATRYPLESEDCVCDAFLPCPAHPEGKCQQRYFNPLDPGSPIYTCALPQGHEGTHNARS